MVSLPAAAAPHRMPRFLSPSKRGDTNWYRPPQTRYGAHVASQRCTILRSGKAIILSRNAQLMATPKTQIVLDMGYTLDSTLHKAPLHEWPSSLQAFDTVLQECFHPVLPRPSQPMLYGPLLGCIPIFSVKSPRDLSC